MQGGSISFSPYVLTRGRPWLCGQGLGTGGGELGLCFWDARGSGTAVRIGRMRPWELGEGSSAVRLLFLVTWVQVLDVTPTSYGTLDT